MGIAAFDTLKTSKDLAEAGFEVRQAEAIATALGDAVSESAVTKADMARQENRIARLDEHLEGVATKADIDRVEDRVAGVEGCVAGVEGRVAGVEGRVARVEDRLSGVEDRLSRVEDRLSGVEDRLARVETRLEVTATKADVYRGLLFQAGAIVAALAALNLLP